MCRSDGEEDLEKTIREMIKKNLEINDLEKDLEINDLVI